MAMPFAQKDMYRSEVGEVVVTSVPGRVVTTDERCRDRRYANKTELCAVAAKVFESLGDKGLSARFDMGNLNARLRISKKDEMLRLETGQAQMSFHCQMSRLVPGRSLDRQLVDVHMIDLQVFGAYVRKVTKDRTDLTESQREFIQFLLGWDIYQTSLAAAMEMFAYMEPTTINKYPAPSGAGDNGDDKIDESGEKIPRVLMVNRQDISNPPSDASEGASPDHPPGCGGDCIRPYFRVWVHQVVVNLLVKGMGVPLSALAHQRIQ
jgi:hypothetical protein